MQALSKVFLPLVLIAAYTLNMLTTCLLPKAIIDRLNHHICILLWFYCLVLSFTVSATHYIFVVMVIKLKCPQTATPQGEKKGKSKPHLSEVHRLPSVGLQTEVQMKNCLMCDAVQAAVSQTKHLIQSVMVSLMSFSVISLSIKMRSFLTQENTGEKL